MKGVGRIYQQTFVDTYSKGPGKLYTTKTPITADLLNDKVCRSLPAGIAVAAHDDRSNGYCGKLKATTINYIAINEIEHTKTKAKSPQTNGICERFHKTILQEFYQVIFRKALKN